MKPLRLLLLPLAATLTAASVLATPALGLAAVDDRPAAGLHAAGSRTTTPADDEVPAVAPPSILSPAPGSTTAQTTVSGTALPGATLTLVLDGVTLVDEDATPALTADASGAWAHAEPLDLADGTHTIEARQTVHDGGLRITSDPARSEFTVGAAAPGGPGGPGAPGGPADPGTRSAPVEAPAPDAPARPVTAWPVTARPVTAWPGSPPAPPGLRALDRPGGTSTAIPTTTSAAVTGSPDGTARHDADPTGEPVGAGSAAVDAGGGPARWPAPLLTGVALSAAALGLLLARRRRHEATDRTDGVPGPTCR